LYRVQRLPSQNRNPSQWTPRLVIDQASPKDVAISNSSRCRLYHHSAHRRKAQKVRARVAVLRVVCRTSRRSLILVAITPINSARISRIIRRLLCLPAKHLSLGNGSSCNSTMVVAPPISSHSQHQLSVNARKEWYTDRSRPSQQATLRRWEVP